MEKPVAQESPITSVIQAFEQNTKPIFVVYGATSHFEQIISDFRSHCQMRENILYLILDMELAKRETLEDTFFEILQQIGYWFWLIANIIHSGKKSNIEKMFQNLRHLKDAINDYQANDKLVEFVRFADDEFFPLLKDLCPKDSTILVECNRFEQVAEWGKNMRSHLFDRFRKHFAGVTIRFVLFANSLDEPRLYYGSDRETALTEITLHKMVVMDRTVIAPLVNRYDVFLCYNTRDTAIVKKISEQLSERGLLPWFDEWQAMSAKLLVDEIEKDEKKKSVAVCIGASDGIWQDREQSEFIRVMIRENMKVLTVYLPDCAENVEIPLFLKLLPAIDFRRGRDPQAFEKLIWYITEKKENLR